jgi:hypothetical protein
MGCQSYGRQEDPKDGDKTKDRFGDFLEYTILLKLTSNTENEHHSGWFRECDFQLDYRADLLAY